VALIFATGAVQERYEYDAYGRCYVLDPDFAIDADGSSDYDNPYLFTGRRWDILNNGSLKIQYSRNRYYDYHTGRFLTHDPLGITPNPPKPNNFGIIGQYKDGLNLYEYVRSNPVVYADVLGLYPIPFPPPDYDPPPPPPPFDLRSVCDNYTCKKCCDVGIMGYDKEAKKQCYREANKLSSDYEQWVKAYWADDRTPWYTTCDRYQGMIISKGFADYLTFFYLKLGTHHTWRWHWAGGIDFNFVGVFHLCNRRKVFYNPERPWRYRYEPGETSDGTLDPWDRGRIPWIYNKGDGNPHVQPGRSSDETWR